MERNRKPGETVGRDRDRDRGGTWAVLSSIPEG